ncbi:TetR/AcrR family transcriptional regulator [Streptomyces sp. NPDC051561]|uniref:TetR/AcrR family transcriptional regulator n=1 Tax=Streptomyces sp. NPDC051561 TaxID=3365658 RepID=UPI0037A8000D
MGVGVAWRGWWWGVAAKVGLTAERVVRAAADLADEVGFERLTVSAVARGFGVKDASLYSHVRGLEDLRVRVALLAAGEFADRVGEAVAGRAGRDALIAYAGAYRDFARERPGRYAATQVRVPAGAAVAAGATGPGRCAETTYAVLRGYGLQEPAATDAVRLLRATFHGFAQLEAGEGFTAARDVEASWARIVEALHVALEGWPRE